MCKKGFVALLMAGCLLYLPAQADLLADEQGPTAYGAVDTLTAGDEFLLPSYTVPAQPVAATLPTPKPIPSDMDILTEIFGKDAVSSESMAIGSSPRNTQTFKPNNGLQKTNEPLLTELPPIPRLENEVKIPPKTPMIGRSEYADQMLLQMTDTADDSVMPKELKITFYPRQSTFSSQSLKWIKAFAVRVLNDPRLVAEIRVSGSDWPVQERRLSVVTQVLAEEGLSSHQIRIYKTDRDENTVLIGYGVNSEYTLTKKERTKHEKTQKTINW